MQLKENMHTIYKIGEMLQIFLSSLCLCIKEEIHSTHGLMINEIHLKHYFVVLLCGSVSFSYHQQTRVKVKSAVNSTLLCTGSLLLLRRHTGHNAAATDSA